ncbi:MAG: hypothetical protein GY832_02650 [Chloroflexi bacterium]|nr:hypothetical protein [Chloroflexota bacterium]
MMKNWGKMTGVTADGYKEPHWTTEPPRRNGWFCGAMPNWEEAEIFRCREDVYRDGERWVDYEERPEMLWYTEEIKVSPLPEDE